jgi:hypothetical protein
MCVCSILLPSFSCHFGLDDGVSGYVEIEFAKRLIERAAVFSGLTVTARTGEDGVGEIQFLNQCKQI